MKNSSHLRLALLVIGLLLVIGAIGCATPQGGTAALPTRVGAQSTSSSSGFTSSTSPTGPSGPTTAPASPLQCATSPGAPGCRVTPACQMNGLRGACVEFTLANQATNKFTFLVQSPLDQQPLIFQSIPFQDKYPDPSGLKILRNLINFKILLNSKVYNDFARPVYVIAQYTKGEEKATFAMFDTGWTRLQTSECTEGCPSSKIAAISGYHGNDPCVAFGD